MSEDHTKDMKPITVKLEGTGEHPFTKVLNAETGENIGIMLGVVAAHVKIGGHDGYPRPRLVLELDCPVELDLKTEA